MTDFDFDEIDKAVTTALGSNDDSATSHDTEEVSTPKESTPQEVTPPTRPVEEPVRSSRPAPAARRSSGRFMDVVHPSSDMRVPGRAMAPKEAAVPPQASQVEDTPVDKTDSFDEADWKTPLDSPFLPDAQVEKRPLGGSAPTGAQLLLDEPDELRLEEPDELRLEAPDDATTSVKDEPFTMPDPLDFSTANTSQDDTEPKITEESDLSRAAVLDSEAHFVPGEEEAVGAAFGDPVVPVQTESAPEPVVEREPELKPEVEPTPVASQSVIEETPEVTGPVSITQQYKEKPAEITESGAIYDTENYHQPITTPEKKKSGTWAILWILLILILGGGGGAAFYFYVLPML